MMLNRNGGEASTPSNDCPTGRPRHPAKNRLSDVATRKIGQETRRSNDDSGQGAKYDGCEDEDERRNRDLESRAQTDALSFGPDGQHSQDHHGKDVVNSITGREEAEYEPDGNCRKEANPRGESCLTRESATGDLRKSYGQALEISP
jgi:hypothetical protein